MSWPDASLATSEGHDLVGAEFDVASTAHRPHHRRSAVLNVLRLGHPDGLASTSKSTIVPGTRPNRSRISIGMLQLEDRESCVILRAVTRRLGVG